MEGALRAFALLVITFALLCATARAYEFGTDKDRAAVRWDTERLLARTIAEQKKTSSDLAITDVVTDGDWALAVYHIGDYRGFMTLHKFWGQWWDMADGSVPDGSCRIDRVTPPVIAAQSTVHSFGMTDRCLTAAGLPSSVLAQAEKIDSVRTANAAYDAHLREPGIKTTPGNGAYDAPEPHSYVACFICDKHLRPDGGKITDPWASSTGGYITTIKYGRPVNFASAEISHFYGRAPTENESTQHPHGDAFYFFTLGVSGAPVSFPEGTTIDVWFPHVLFPNLRYRITAGWGSKSFGPIKGTLANNTLHFVLPQFTLAPGESMMYEIDGDP